MAPTSRAAWFSGSSDYDSSSSCGGPRLYADPWDLSGASSPALDCSQSDFSYRPRYPDSLSSGAAAAGGRYHLCGVEEEDFCNERYLRDTSPPLGAAGDCCRCGLRPSSVEEMYEHGCYEDDDVYPCELYSASVCLRRATARLGDLEGHRPSLVYVYHSGSRRKKMALPKRGCMLDWDRTMRLQHASRSRGRLLGGWNSEDASEDTASSADEPVSHSYDEVSYYCGDTARTAYSTAAALVAPQHFGLSRYGHLKIDYSCSWDCLDKYIASD